MKKQKKDIILRINGKWLILGLSFALSCINAAALIAWLILAPFFLIFRYGREGAVEAFILLQLRSILSTGVAAPITSTAGYIKWSVVFLLSFYLLAGYKDVRNPELKRATGWIALFSIFAAFAAWILSSYPVTSNFKTLSYAIPFIAILIGISETPEVDWVGRIKISLGIMCLGSSVLLFSSTGYLISGSLFQGVFNHPNLFAITLALFIAVALYDANRISLKVITLLLLSLFLLYRSGSRTGALAAIIVVLFWLLSLSNRFSEKIAIISLLLIFASILVFLDSPLVQAMSDFVYKYGSSDILASREGQIESVWRRFQTSPIFGTGFNVPYRSGMRSYEFSFDLITENGNLILAVLGDTGVIGFLLFFIAYFRLYQTGHGVRNTIFFAPFLVSMGEMAFFSTNNIAILMYLYFGIYACDGWKKRKADAL